jgi:hypothetical protein
MSDDETDELYMELLQRDTTISELNQQIDELESENGHLKKMIENLTVVKRKRGDDISCINCSLLETLKNIIVDDNTILNSLLCDYNLDGHHKFINHLLVGVNEDMTPIAILSDKLIAYQEGSTIKYIDICILLEIIMRVLTPFVKEYVNEMIEQHEQNDQVNISECYTSAETMNTICKNTQTILKCELSIKKIVKIYQST